MKLSREVIRKAITQLEHQKATGNHVDAEKFAERIKDEVKWNTPTKYGDLRASTRVIKLGENHFRVIQDAKNFHGQPYTDFVEFGTGYIGKSNPHTLANNVGWKYADGATVSKNRETDTMGWAFVGKDGKSHWTIGQEASMQMFRAWDYYRYTEGIELTLISSGGSTWSS